MIASVCGSLCTDSGYHSGKGQHKGRADKITLFVSPDKAMPRAELRQDRSGHRSLTDIKAGTKNWDLGEGKQGTGQSLTLKTWGSGRIDKTASSTFLFIKLVRPLTILIFCTFGSHTVHCCLVRYDIVHPVPGPCLEEQMMHGQRERESHWLRSTQTPESQRSAE